MPLDPAVQVEEALRRYRALGWPAPQVVLVSGSGLAVELEGRSHGPRPLADLLPFPVHPVAGHPHEIELLEPLPGRTVLYFRGRLHSYSGYDAHQVVLPVRLGALLGAETLLMTNAAGGVRPGLRPGQLFALRDQLNLTGLSPLRGGLPAAWGPAFTVMAGAHDEGLRRLAMTKADELGLELGEAVYGGLAGPAYETPAEVAMLRTLGADLTGMSTVLEVIAARQMGLRCLCLSLVSNLAGAVTADHVEVLAAGRAAGNELRRLLVALLADRALYAAGN